MWTPTATPPPLAPDEVHVWRLRLDLPQALARERLATIGDLLTDEEQQRARRFTSDIARTHFIAARAALRRLLSEYVGLAPAELQFVYGAHGKPSLQHPSTDITFNLSHSGQRMLLAVSRSRDVGVDVERTQRAVDWHAVARRFFAPPEQAAMKALPDDEQRQAFFRCWTRKEAFMKATGQGVAYGLTRFAVSLTRDNPTVQWLEQGEPGHWGLADVNLDAEHVGAVCASGRDWRVVALAPADPAE